MTYDKLKACFILFLCSASGLRAQTNPTRAEIIKAIGYIKLAAKCYYGVGTGKMGSAADEKKVCTMLRAKPPRFRPMGGKMEARNPHAFFMTPPDEVRTDSKSKTAINKKNVSNKDGIIMHTRRINKLGALGKPGLAIIAAMVLHELWHDLQQDVTVSKLKSPPATKQDREKSCAAREFKYEYAAYCKEQDELTKVLGTPPKRKILQRLQEILEKKEALIEAYLKAQLPPSASSPGLLEGISSKTIENWQIKVADPHLWGWDAATGAFSNSIDVGMSSIRDIFVSGNTLLACGNRNTANGTLGRVVLYDISSNSISNAVETSSASFGAVFWDRVSGLLYVHDDMNDNLRRASYTGGNLPVTFGIWVQSLSLGNGVYSNPELRSAVNLIQDSAAEITAVPRLNSTNWGNVFPGQELYRYTSQGGAVLRAAVPDYPYDLVMWHSGTKDGDVSIEISGPAGQTFVVEDVDLATPVGAGTFAADAFTTQTLVTGLDYRKRYWIRPISALSIDEYSAILLPIKESGTPQILSNGKGAFCGTNTTFVGKDFNVVRSGGITVGDLVVIVLGDPSVSSIVYNGTTAIIANPVLTASKTAALIDANIPGLGVTAAFDLPIANDPALGGAEFYVQIAVWDAASSGWKFSQVVTQKIWSEDPHIYQSPTSSSSKQAGRARRFSSMQQKIARHRWCQTLMGQHGYKAGRLALQRRMKR